MLKRVPKVNDVLIALEDDYWNDVVIEEDKYITKGYTYHIEGVSTSGDSAYFYNENNEKIWVDEEAFYLYELVSEDKTTVTHEFTYPKINLIGSQVHGENFYEDATYFNFEFKYKGNADVLFDKLSSLQADIVKLLSEKYQ